MFQDKPVALTRLGERLVGWRDRDGALKLVADQCPHRGIALSLGRVIDGNIACRYHGVQVAGDGTVAAVPALPTCTLVDPMHTTYLHEESYSMGIDQRTDLVDVKATPTGLLVTRRNDPSNIEAM